MENKPSGKRRSYLSANSLKLREEDVYGFTPRSVKLALASAAVAVLLLVIISVLAGRNNSRFELAKVSEQGFSFSVQYFKGAAVQRSRGTNYLVDRDENGKETTLWITELESSLSCGRNPTFSYRPTVSKFFVRESCSGRDGHIFVSDIVFDNKVYQINMTSDKPIDQRDAQTIFSTISIER